MGDKYDCLFRRVPKFQELILQNDSGLRIQRAEGLVHQDQLGVVNKRSNDIGALAHGL